MKTSRVVTYSPSMTIALTRACANRCLYCGFREEGAGLLPLEEIERIALQACNLHVSEVLVMAGENADNVPSIKEALCSLGIRSMTQWAKKVCEFLLGRELLPHVNIGTLDYEDLKELKRVSASMGLMMEGDYGAFGSRVHPQKNFSNRIRNLKWAGQLKIPFTTGILMGLGEAQKERIRSIEAIADVANTYGHVQEIILQNYIQNNGSLIPAKEISRRELKEIVGLCKEIIPDVHLQIPVNLNTKWHELLSLGFDDLGGISLNGDVVNPDSPWPPVEKVNAILKKRHYHLRKRLPLYPKYFKQGWYSGRVGKVIGRWISNEDDYRYYAE
jgi:7,8-didemethyl-8-hydroxy-5-deazariboflavin synthase CofG subunit